MATVADLERRVRRLEDDTAPALALVMERELREAADASLQKDIVSIRDDLRAIRTSTTWMFRLFLTTLATVAAGVLVFFITKVGP